MRVKSILAGVALVASISIVSANETADTTKAPQPKPPVVQEPKLPGSSQDPLKIVQPPRTRNSNWALIKELFM